MKEVNGFVELHPVQGGMLVFLLSGVCGGLQLLMAILMVHIDQQHDNDDDDDDVQRNLCDPVLDFYLEQFNDQICFVRSRS